MVRRLVRTKAGTFVSVTVSRGNAPALKVVSNEPPSPRRTPGAQLPEYVPDNPELRHGMKRAEALQMFEPLPIPASWTVYAVAPEGDVAARMFGMARLLRAARLLYDMGTVDLSQRRTENGTEYLIRRSRR